MLAVASLLLNASARDKALSLQNEADRRLLTQINTALPTSLRESKGLIVFRLLKCNDVNPIDQANRSQQHLGNGVQARFSCLWHPLDLGRCRS